MVENGIVRSVCGLCSGCCGVLIELDDHKPVKIKGDPESPLNRGALCRKALTSLEYIDHPDRIKSPLKRAGKRGEDRWEKISWGDAFQITAEGLNRNKEKYGPQSVFMVHGSAKSFIDTLLVRLANSFGTPNVVSSDHVCHVPRMLGAEFTFGYFPIPEIDHPPACILAWGVNHAKTRFFKYGLWLEAQKRGTQLVAIDPFPTEIAKAADLWIRLRPGTDLAFALGMIHVMINGNLVDREFIDQWAIGFERLKAHVKPYNPGAVSKICSVPENEINKTARLFYDCRPGYIEYGNAIDHNLNSFQASRAISSLSALAGNLDVPGGSIESAGTGFRYGDKESSAVGILGRWSHELELRDMISKEARQKKVAPDLLPDFRYVPPQAVVNAVLEKDPYPIHAGYIQASNPLTSWCDAKKTFEAFAALDFLAVSDFFITPTAALADVVFPSATFLEFDGIQMPPAPGSFIAQAQRKTTQVGECRSDIEIVNGLANALGLGEHFWKTAEDFWDYVLKPTGLSFEAFQQKDRLMADMDAKEYKKYEKRGFKTTSGKVELYSEQLEQLGFDPLPDFREIPDFHKSTSVSTDDFPLICTSFKVSAYRHSTGRQIKALRQRHPDPIVFIHPETADKNSIKEGDWVYIENKKGKITQKARLSPEIDPRVVVAEAGWWFPERTAAEGYGWDQSNYNILTDDDAPAAREVGSNNTRGFACKIYKY